MKILHRFLLFVAVVISPWAIAQNSTAQQPAEELLQQYLQTWSMPDADERLALLKKIWLPDGVHENPFGRSEGIQAISDEITGFQESFPGATVHFDNIRQTGRHIVCRFNAENAAGEKLFSGIDYFEVSASGLLIQVVGFID